MAGIQCKPSRKKTAVRARASTQVFSAIVSFLSGCHRRKCLAVDLGANTGIETFAMLSTRPQPTKPTPRAKLAKPAEKLLGEAEAVLARGGGGKFRAMREAQKRDCEQLLATLASFG